MTLTGLCRTLAPVALFALACSDPSSPAASTKLETLPRDLSVAEKNLISGSNAFAFDLLREINIDQRTENVFVSPLSASMALGMTMNGAAGSTFDAMRSTLRLGTATREDIISGYKSLIDLLRDLDKSTDFRIANSIWYEKSFPFNASFISESEQYFDAEVSPLDFRDNASVGKINSWVNDATGKKIPTIIDQIPPDEVMYLINAIYFKGAWRSRFDKSKTADAPFFALDGSSKNVPMMMQSATFGVAYGADYTAVDLPYGNSAFTMTIVLPNPGTDINAFAESMTLEKWQALDASLHERPIPLFLPRFKLEWEKTLNDDLASLGMGMAFISADFTRMSPEGKRLIIDKVLQKTFVDVNEEGTEAAAATIVGMVPVSAPAPVRVDRPFMVAIRERLSGTILFIGKIVTLPD
jgi:serine protease inhibitor